MQPKPFPESQNHGDWRESKSRRPFFRSLLGHALTGMGPNLFSELLRMPRFHHWSPAGRRLRVRVNHTRAAVHQISRSVSAKAPHQLFLCFKHYSPFGLPKPPSHKCEPNFLSSGSARKLGS